jgi:exodeoxyribonuclease-3
MKVVSWNVNSLKVRLPHLEAWIKLASPDVLALQELKLETSSFPLQALHDLGYLYCAVSGQKTYNGVALLSRLPINDIQEGIPDYNDPQRRVIAGTINDVRIVNLYVVNGQAVGSEKYTYKMDWLKHLLQWLEHEQSRFPKRVVLGDFNIAPDDRDVHDPEAWRDQILCSVAEREALQQLCKLDLFDSFRLFEPQAGHYSWWDYRQAAFRRNQGLRIDLIWVSHVLKNHLKAAGIDRLPRTWERPSDHAPVWIDLEL